MEQFGKVTIIGVGLLGGSLGLALKKKRLAKEVWGLARRESSRVKALKYKAVDHATLSLWEAAWNADLVVLATPITSFTQYLGMLSLLARRGCIVTDVGSVKGPLVSEWEAAAWPLPFVGSHPMTGSEKTGVAEARADLYRGATCVTTPTRKTSPRALASVEHLWKAVGCKVVRLGPREHDEKIGLVSHLPHAAAFSLVRAVSPGLRRQDWVLAGKGYRDTTRVGASDGGLWADIFLANRRVLLKGLKAYGRELEGLARLLERNDRPALRRLLDQAAEVRKKMPPHGQE
jgi:prephenate dehydrogenase